VTGHVLKSSTALTAAVYLRLLLPAAHSAKNIAICRLVLGPVTVTGRAATDWTMAIDYLLAALLMGSVFSAISDRKFLSLSAVHDA
jgi:hypothetical protein